MVTIGGFFLVFILVSVSATIALSAVNSLRSNLDHVVSVNAEKLRQIAIMRHANRERIIGLQTMVLLDDVFEIDEIAMQHMGHANHFIAARRKLYDMAETSNETEALDRIRLASMEAYPINTEIRDLALAEEQDSAKDLMLTKLVPVQEKIYVEFSRLASLYENDAQIANQAASMQVDSVNKRILILSGFVTLLCIVIASSVSRRIHRSESALILHRDDLELKVASRTVELANEIKERELAERFAIKESKRLAVTLASIGDAVVTINPDNAVDYINPEAERLLDVERRNAVGESIDSLLQIVDRETQDSIKILASESTTISKQDAVLRMNDGPDIDIQWTVAPISDEVNTVYGSVIVLRDVSESKALSRRLSHEATHDPLTGLVNRREFERNLSNAISSVKSQGSTHMLCYIDLDNFKIVNDTAGHSAGDTLLKEVGSTLDAQVGNNATLARLGGDEFGLLLNDCTLTDAEIIAERLLQSVKDYRLLFNGQSFSVGASIGLIGIPSDTPDLQSLLSMADAACYTAKKKGRNCVSVFHDTDSDIISVRDSANLAVQIRSALKNRNFELHYQSIVGIGPEVESTSHHEILIRMKKDDNSLLYPQSFLPAAERYGLLPAIDQYVIDEIFGWIAAGYGLNMTGRLSINISGSSLSDPDFLDFVKDASSRHKIDLHLIIFELTESVAISNLSAAVDFIETLSANGCQFALDDFGKGYSSFTHIKELPVDYLKIDGEFVKDILTNPTDEATVRAINELGHALGMSTVAEFVESDQICQRLKQLGVDFAQGFALDKPSPLPQGSIEPTLVDIELSNVA